MSVDLHFKSVYIALNVPHIVVIVRIEDDEAARRQTMHGREYSSQYSIDRSAASIGHAPRNSRNLNHG